VVDEPLHHRTQCSVLRCNDRDRPRPSRQRTPKDIVERIAKEVARAVAAPALAERIAGFGDKPLGNSPEQFAAMIAADTKFWAEAVRIAGVEER
jgi:tripartite-type tricarboxylate transporter receptor subunit TctC